MTVRRSPRTNCIVWNLFCKPEFYAYIAGRHLSTTESEDIFNYMKLETLKMTQKVHQEQMDAIRRQAAVLEPHLPLQFRADWQAINAQPDVAPEKIVPTDALNPANYL